jgi:spore coat polysaccharide biosynthesis predicted glycosyltransferase SpsG
LGAFTVKEKLSSLINGTYVKDNPELSEHPVDHVIIDFSRVSKADSTALDKIKEVCYYIILLDSPNHRRYRLVIVSVLSNFHFDKKRWNDFRTYVQTVEKLIDGVN